MNKYITLFVALILITTSVHSQTNYNMNDSAVVADSGYFNDSGGPSEENVGFMISCVYQATYTNNEHFIKTFNSTNGMSFMFNFSLLHLLGSDNLKIYDGNSISSQLIKTLSVSDTSALIFSSGTSITFEFTSYNNGSTLGCDNGGNWISSFETIPLYKIDEPAQIQTCNAILTDDGGPYGDYSSSTIYEKTFCSANYSCISLNFNELNIAAGDLFFIYKGTSATGTPIAQFTEGTSPTIVSSEEEQCMTIKFVSDATSQSSGWIAKLTCSDNCMTIPQCSSNPPADNQCITATPICNLNGYCGNTSSTYTYIDHLGNDWNNNTSLSGSFCGTIENNSWLSFVAQSGTATFNIWTMNCVNGTGIQMEIYSTTDCQNFTPYSDCVSNGVESNFVIHASGLTMGETYYLMIDGYAGDVCDYVIAADFGVFTGVAITPSQYICPGQTVNISVDGMDETASYNWSSSPTDTSMQIIGHMIVAKPSASTQYSVDVSGPYINPDCGAISQTYNSTVSVLDINDPQCLAKYLCDISISASDSTICQGDNVTLLVDSSLFVVLMDNDFNDSTIGAGWSSTVQATFENPCGQNTANDTYLWMGDISPAPRHLTSEDFNVLYGGLILFDLRYSIQADASPCEGPDEIDEGITLQYSTDYGVNWTPIAYFNPSGVIEPNGNNYLGMSTVVTTSNTVFTDWADYSFNIPADAKTEHTRFRWIQEVSTDFDYDHWGLDNIKILAVVPETEVYWTSLPAGFAYTGGEPPVQSPLNTTTFIAELTDGQHSCFDSVLVNVGNNNYIYGNVTYSGGNLQTGDALVKLYNADLPGFNIIDISEIASNGHYSFDSLQNNNCFLKVDLFNNSSFPNLHNTYYDSTFQWNEAFVINLTGCDSLELPVKMFEITNNGNGNGSIEGNIINNTENKSTLGTGIQDVSFTLESDGNSLPVQNRITDASGNYKFENLPEGSYTIYVDIPNIPLITTHTVILNSIDSVFTNINFYLDTVTGNGIYADTLMIFDENSNRNAAIITWPNPVKNNLNVLVKNHMSKTLYIDIINSNGNKLYSKQLETPNENSSAIKINTEVFANGLYFLKVTIGNETYIKKFIKE